MIRKNFVLCFLVINIMLPICFSFITVLSCKSVDNDTYMATPINCPEEESKEENSPFEKEKEKNLISIGFAISPFVSLLENNIYLHNHSKPINISQALPYNPPELF